MRVIVKATRAGRIKDLDKRDDLQLVENSQDVAEIKKHFGNRPAVQPFDGFFVDVGEGEYGDVFGYEGSVPYDWKDIYKITQTYQSGTKYAERKKTRAKSSRGASSSGLGSAR